MGKTLQEFLENMNSLDPFQSGFSSGSELALVTLIHDFYHEWDRGNTALFLFLSHSAAFDTTEHGILMDQLCGMRTGGTVQQWFH